MKNKINNDSRNKQSNRTIQLALYVGLCTSASFSIFSWAKAYRNYNEIELNNEKILQFVYELNSGTRKI